MLLLCTVGYDSSVVVYKWFQPKEEAVQFDPGGLELPVMVIHDFILDDCSYNSTFSESFIPYGWRLGVVASVVRRMNEVTAHWARLVLGWVTVFGRVYHHGV